MSEVLELVHALKQKGIRVWAEGNELRYSAPPGSFDEETKARVRAQRSTLIDWLLNRCDGAAVPQKVSRETDTFRASFSQRRMWFLERIAAGAYNCPAVVPLASDLDLASLKNALTTITQRHETLRSVFRLEGVETVQVVQPGIELDVQRLLARDAADGQRIADEFFGRSFDLEHGPLIRTAVVHLNGMYFLLLSLHHIATDGWSVGVLASELRQLMEGRTLVPVEWQYADFADWQYREFEARIQTRQLPWWEKQLAGAPAALDFPTDWPRPAVFSNRGGLYRRTLAPDLNRHHIEAMARKFGVTPYMLLLAAFQSLLHRYTAEDDICIGTPVANRIRPEFAGTVGCFVNTVVMRGHPQPLKTFSQFLAEIRDMVIGAFDHQEVPFELLVEHLKLARDTSRHPLFQVMFVLQTNDGAENASLAASGNAICVQNVSAKFDMNVALAAVDGLYHLECEYAADLYAPETMDRLFCHFENLLRIAALTPELPIGLIDYLDPEDRDWLASVSVGSRQPEYLDEPLIRRFERQASATPDAVAVRCDELVLNYAELNAESDSLAAQLSTLGVGRGAICALIMDRSLAMVRTILAILKCGAAYLPIDPTLPKVRIAFIIHDAGAAATAIQPTFAELVSEAHCPILVCEESAPPSAGHKPVHVNGEDWAYVLYTSGTTGQPKGVVNHQAGLANRISWMQKNFPIGPGDAVLQKTNYAFDVSVWEFVWPLSVGASLVMAAPGRHGDPVYLTGLIEKAGVTVLHFVPSMLAGFLTIAKAPQLTTLRAVFASGEALVANTVEQFRELKLGARLFNLYGPTEAAIDVTVWDCDEVSPHPDLVPLGRPIDNMEIHVVDALGQLVPPGVCGELCIGGVGLATGYLNLPRITAASFVPHPATDGARLYRTGDRVRWRREGLLEYFGRLDFQVKLRGLRIELGEIETQLLAQSGIVNAAAMVIRAAGNGEQYLIAYVQEDGEATDAAALEARLKDALRLMLPEYMVPQRVIALAVLPLNANGKLDRKVLMARQMQLAAEETQAVAAGSDTEHRVQAVWAEILGLAQIGVTRNFFDAGGTSLLMVVVQQKLSEQLEREIPLVQFFTNPTIRDLARYLDGNAAVATIATEIEIRTQGAARLGQLRRRSQLGIKPIDGITEREQR